MDHAGVNWLVFTEALVQEAQDENDVKQAETNEGSGRSAIIGSQVSDRPGRGKKRERNEHRQVTEIRASGREPPAGEGEGPCPNHHLLPFRRWRALGDVDMLSQTFYRDELADRTEVGESSRPIRGEPGHERPSDRRVSGCTW